MQELLPVTFGQVHTKGLKTQPYCRIAHID